MSSQNVDPLTGADAFANGREIIPSTAMHPCWTDDDSEICVAAKLKWLKYIWPGVWGVYSLFS